MLAWTLVALQDELDYVMTAFIGMVTMNEMLIDAVKEMPCSCWSDHEPCLRCTTLDRARAILGEFSVEEE